MGEGGSAVPMTKSWFSKSSPQIQTSVYSMMAVLFFFLIVQLNTKANQEPLIIQEVLQLALA